MKTIAFFNQKGGTGKSTLSIQFYDYLSNKRMRVKGIDCDPQRHFATTLPGNAPDEESNCQYIPLEDVKIHVDLLKPSYDYCIIDFPGYVSSQHSDVIIDYLFIPLRYSQIDNMATKRFVKIVGSCFKLNNIPSMFYNMLPTINSQIATEHLEKSLLESVATINVLKNHGSDKVSPAFKNNQNKLFQEILDIISI